MEIEEIRRKIESNLNSILGQKGCDPVMLNDQMTLLSGEIPIDSLDLAVLLTQMQQQTGKDPFKDGFRNFRTVGELAQLYKD